MIPNGTKVTMRGVKLIFRNFRGDPGPFNQKGTRTFGVLLDDETAEAMAADEWNVKWLEPRDEDEDETRQPFLPVACRFDNIPPKITVINSISQKQERWGEDMVEMLDAVDILNVDLIVAANVYDVQGKKGVKAYLRTMFVTIDEDELEAEYNQKAMDQQEER